MDSLEDPTDHAESFYPDGLTAEAVEALLCEARPFWDAPISGTSALLDGSAFQRRQRRATRRAIGSVVRALPTRSAHTRLLRAAVAGDAA